MILWKQARLFSYWAVFAAEITLFAIVTSMNASNSEEHIESQIVKYIGCVLIAGDDEDCTLTFDHLPPFSLVMATNIFLWGFPIVTFIVFGGRKEIFLFWKEYLAHCWKHKTLALEFVPSFDPQVTSSTTIQTLEDIEHSRNSQLTRNVNEL